MRSIKTMLLLAVMAMALAVPATASAAQWTEGGSPITEPLQWTNGGAPLEGEVPISFTGPVKFYNGGLGSIECTASFGGLLAAGTEGSLFENSISPASCKLGVVLKMHCSGVTSVTVSSFWAVEAAEKSPGVRTMTIKMGKITFGLQPIAGKECPPQLELTGGTITATPDNAKSISSVSLSGSVGSIWGAFGVSGTLAATPAAKYGIVRDENVVALSGYIKYSNVTIGSVECSVNGSMTLRPGEKGEVTAMSSNANACAVGGPKAVQCGATATAVFKELPWPVSLTAAKTINITKFPFEIQFGKGCAPWVLSGGEMGATPDSTSAITKITLSGTLTGSFSMPWTGVLSWTPSGQYGIS
jgi:hypothetical protein